MKPFNIAIIGCGTVGGGVAKIIQEINGSLVERSGRAIKVTKVVELNPPAAMERFGLPQNIFCGGGKVLVKEETGKYIEEVLNDSDIDLLVPPTVSTTRSISESFNISKKY